MSDWIPKPGNIKVGGLSRAAQKAQAARDKAAHAKTGEKPAGKANAAAAFKAKETLPGTRKTSFQRKAV